MPTASHPHPRTQKVLDVAKQQLALYLAKWPKAIVTVWSSGKVHGAYGSLGIKFPTRQDAADHLTSLGFITTETSLSYTEFSKPEPEDEDPRAGLAGNIGEHEDHFNDDGSARA